MFLPLMPQQLTLLAEHLSQHLSNLERFQVENL
jgi:hypothetical protein